MSVFNATVIRLVQQNLYMLKRQYGGPLVLCSLTDADTDYQTGSKVVQYRTWHIDRAIVLPCRMTHDLVAGGGRIASNKKLAYGGEFNVGDRGFIIQGKDVPVGWKVKKDDWILYRGARYSVKVVFNVCGGVGWTVITRRLAGVPLTFHVQVHSAVRLNEEASA